MNELQKRLEYYYLDRDITDITLKEAIAECIGAVTCGTYEEIYEEIDHETDSFTYDVNFECILISLLTYFMLIMPHTCFLVFAVIMVSLHCYLMKT